MTLYEPCACCGGIIHPTAQGDNQDDFNDEILRIAKLIHAGKTLNFDAALLRAQAGQILKAVSSGYGSSLPDVAFNSPDFNMLANLTQNVYQFSAAKNYQELKDMSLALRDGDKVRSWSEYKTAVEAINKKYNGDFLRTEYNTAISSSQMASRWTQFESEKEDFPMLKYQTIGDANVRDFHAALNGVKKKVDDSFWNSYFPPNGWNCRCEATQVTGTAKETADDKITLPSVPKMFKTNLAKTGVVFPLGHPYYVGVPDDILTTQTKAGLNKYYDGIVNSWIEEKIEAKEQILELKNFNSGKIAISRTALKNILNHASVSRKLITIHIPELLPEMKKMKSSDIKKEKEDEYKKKGIIGVNQYSFNLGEKDYVLITREYKDAERLYAVRTNKKSN